MREIEFRGKYDLISEFTYGDLIHGVGTKYNKMYILPNVINLAKVKNCHPLDGVSVIPETIGQYTGLKDINGTKVFSKDYVKQGDSLFRVEMCIGGFECIEIKLLKNGGFVEGSTYNFSILSDRFCESLGFEPELLKGE